MKNYTITVNGNVYDVVVEEGATTGAAPVAAPKAVAPVAAAPKAAAPAPKAAPVPAVKPAAAPAVTGPDLSDDAELVAVMTAAIAAYEGSATSNGLVVRSIRRVGLGR